ncbi:hypothetical protein Asp14428_18430 [Actinoplanes sp. NBRC 14428]|nr:hypothetical protein Asp14428_18430 [Actinoplanes sp. NBRC 14428]
MTRMKEVTAACAAVTATGVLPIRAAVESAAVSLSLTSFFLFSEIDPGLSCSTVDLPRPYLTALTAATVKGAGGHGCPLFTYFRRTSTGMGIMVDVDGGADGPEG